MSKLYKQEKILSIITSNPGWNDFTVQENSALPEGHVKILMGAKELLCILDEQDSVEIWETSTDQKGLGHGTRVAILKKY
jgi:hypothetical protein